MSQSKYNLRDDPKQKFTEDDGEWMSSQTRKAKRNRKNRKSNDQSDISRTSESGKTDRKTTTKNTNKCGAAAGSSMDCVPVHSIEACLLYTSPSPRDS